MFTPKFVGRNLCMPLNGTKFVEIKMGRDLSWDEICHSPVKPHSFAKTDCYKKFQIHFFNIELRTTILFGSLKKFGQKWLVEKSKLVRRKKTTRAQAIRHSLRK